MEKHNENWKWAPIAGKWSFADGIATFNEPEDPGTPVGLALAPKSLRQGSLEVNVRMKEPMAGSARVAFGFDPLSKNYYTAGIGGYNRAYVVDEFVSGRGWSSLSLQGSKANIRSEEEIHFRAEIRGQTVRLVVDGVTVIETNLPHPLKGNQVGIFTWGQGASCFQQLCRRVGVASRFCNHGVLGTV
ncbi:MAG: hypothetical protein ABSE63_16220 [Thermoguttaceae bacterium]|jgi:hypothetical protein